MADLPLILAGPILRRVEPRLVTVWVALSSPQTLLLTVFEGREKTGTGTQIFSGGQPKAKGAANTLRLGDKLHIGVVFAELPASDQPLLPGLNYSYNLAFANLSSLDNGGQSVDPSGVAPSADLKSLGLLSDQPLLGKPNLPLGYDLGELPGFSLPPANLSDLRLLHGSCRRPAFRPKTGDPKNSFDAMAWVDDLIDTWRKVGLNGGLALDANTRPHQLFLTGDQIYADDVSPTMLPMLNRVGNELIGKQELLPTLYPPEKDDKSKEAFLGVPKLPGFASLKDFITKKTTEKKDPLKELKEIPEIRVREDPCFDRLFTLLFSLPFSKESGIQTDPDDPKIRLWPADLVNLPAEFRLPLLECEARFTSSDLGNHLMSIGEFCAMYLAVWCNAVWEVDASGPALAKIEDVYKLPAGALPQIWDLHACMEGLPQCLSHKDRPALTTFFQKKIQDEDKKRGFDQVNATLTTFFEGLKRVRRALANIPTYMIFDDHDVTDDWNLSQPWTDQVHTAPLGRRILANSLVVYALFQDWGNDPKRYQQGPYRKLLDQAVNLFPANKPDGPSSEVMVELDKMFAFNQPNPEPAPELKWHFSIDGPRHRVIALDTRTRRVFRSRFLPPGLLSPEALREQLPDPVETPLPAGIDVLVVISQTPPLLPSLASAVIVPLTTRIYELRHHQKSRNQLGIDPDNEIWPGDDLAFEALLEALSKYKKVVLLSGEVHYGYSAQMSFWSKGIPRLTLPAGVQADLDNKVVSAAILTAFQSAVLPLSPATFIVLREDNDEWLIIDPQNRKTFLVRKETAGLNVFEEEGPARVAQFVSSGMKNIKGDIAMIARLMGFAFPLIDLSPSERLVWKEDFPVPISLDPQAKLAPAVKDRLSGSPLRLPSRRWPPGTRVKIRPDFTWRIDLVRDERPDAERQDFSHPAEPAPVFDVNAINELVPQDRQTSCRSGRQVAILTRGGLSKQRGVGQL